MLTLICTAVYKANILIPKSEQKHTIIFTSKGGVKNLARKSNFILCSILILSLQFYFMTYNDPQQAFNKAIQEGRLSADAKASNYAGNYMYMGTQNGKDFFKHIMTRNYIQ